MGGVVVSGVGPWPCGCFGGIGVVGGMKAASLALALVALAALFAVNRCERSAGRGSGQLGSGAVPAAEAGERVPALTAGHVVDPRFAGHTFEVVGRVRRVGVTRQGLILVDIHEPEGDVHIGAPVFPSLGCLPVKPVRGDPVRVVGNLGAYQGRPQIRPLSADHLEVVGWSRAEAVSLAEALGRPDEFLLIGPLTATRVERFTSRRGLEHLRLRLAVPDGVLPGGSVGGIVFEGNRTDCEEALLLSGAPVLVSAKVASFRGAPSLEVGRVAALE